MKNNYKQNVDSKIPCYTSKIYGIFFILNFSCDCIFLPLDLRKWEAAESVIMFLLILQQIRWYFTKLSVFFSIFIMMNIEYIFIMIYVISHYIYIRYCIYFILKKFMLIVFQNLFYINKLKNGKYGSSNCKVNHKSTK